MVRLALRRRPENAVGCGTESFLRVLKKSLSDFGGIGNVTQTIESQSLIMSLSGD